MCGPSLIYEYRPTEVNYQLATLDLTLYDASTPHKIVFLLLFQLFPACCYVAKICSSSCGATFLWGSLFGRTCWTCLNPPLVTSPSPVGLDQSRFTIINSLSCMPLWYCNANEMTRYAVLIPVFVKMSAVSTLSTLSLTSSISSMPVGVCYFISLINFTSLWTSSRQPRI